MVNRRVFLAWGYCLPAFAQKKSTRTTGTALSVVSVSARAADGKLNLDGRIRNSGGREIRNLVLIFELLDSDRNVLTRQQGPLDEELLSPGDEAEFHVQMAAHARAVYFRTEFEDGSGRDVRAQNAGPFPIE